MSAITYSHRNTDYRLYVTQCISETRQPFEKPCPVASPVQNLNHYKLNVDLHSVLFLLMISLSITCVSLSDLSDLDCSQLCPPARVFDESLGLCGLTVSGRSPRPTHLDSSVHFSCLLLLINSSSSTHCISLHP